MKAIRTGFHSVLSDGIEQFIAHKRTLGRRYDVEEKTLRLFDRYLTSQKVEHLRQVTPSLIEAFLASRPRKQARSYNHLLRTVRRLLDWLVAQGIVERSPVQTATRRQTAQRIAQPAVLSSRCDNEFCCALMPGISCHFSTQCHGLRVIQH